jgi:hypothetical protein
MAILDTFVREPGDTVRNRRGVTAAVMSIVRRIPSAARRSGARACRGTGNPDPGAAALTPDHEVCPASGWWVRKSCTDGVVPARCPLCDAWVAVEPGRVLGHLVRIIGEHRR